MVGHAQAGQAPQGLADLPNVKKSSYVTDGELDPVNSYAQITNYNNYYEFGTRKTDPAQYAGRLTTRPWTVKIDGMVGKPGDYAIDDLIKSNQLEERIYRHRCVEAWSYFVPWVGFPLKTLIDKVQPTSQAKYVEFTTLMRASEMPGLRRPASRSRTSKAPDGRGDESAHARRRRPVREVLPNQNGAPIRIHIPWKYGFKSGKSIVRIQFTDIQPNNTWAVQTPNEYGFFANVNPTVDHPRWTRQPSGALASSRGARR